MLLLILPLPQDGYHSPDRRVEADLKGNPGGAAVGDPARLDQFHVGKQGVFREAAQAADDLRVRMRKAAELDLH